MKVVRDYKGDVKDIISSILSRDKQSAEHTQEIARELKGETNKGTFRNIWQWVRNKISYIEDKGTQVVKSPGATIKTGIADCKSMSILVGSILQNLGIPYKYRVVFYSKIEPDRGHIYVVAKDGGKEIVIDPVNDRFNHEYSYWKKKEFMGNKVRIQEIQGLGVLRRPEKRKYVFNHRVGVGNIDYFGEVFSNSGFQVPKQTYENSPTIPTYSSYQRNNLIPLIIAGVGLYFLTKK